MKNINKIFIFTNKKYVFKMYVAICFNCIDILPTISIAHQPDPLRYGGVHSYVDIGWLMFHCKINWKGRR